MMVLLRVILNFEVTPYVLEYVQFRNVIFYLVLLGRFFMVLLAPILENNEVSPCKVYRYMSNFSTGA